MLNNKGQVLIMFIMLLPVFLGVCAFIIDLGYITYNKNKLQNIVEYSVEENKDVENELKNNDISNYNITNNENCIIVSYDKQSIFGKIININKYKIKTKSCK